MRILSLLAAVGVVVCSCVNQVEDEGSFMGSVGASASDEQAMTSRCAPGPTVRGIDVSYYQGNVDWAKVKGDGVKFAFVRVSDGVGFHDSKFDRNWSGAKAHGILRGAYQFFRSNEDPIAQADLLIAKVGGHLGPNDLPPVIDVESTDGQSARTIARKVNTWLNHVEARLHVKPIVYTGPYFWQDSVGGADQNDSPLWVAHYGTQCPLVPATWHTWTFHQFTSSGSVRGIGGGVDTNHFNGTMAQLQNLTAGADLPRACVTGHFHGAFCDDEGLGATEDAHDRLKRGLGVDFHCSNIAGHSAFCGKDTATRAQAAFVFEAAAGVPLGGHPNAFHDDNGHPREKYLNAAKAYGILVGSNGNVNPDGKATRSQLAVMLYRMYKLPDVSHDYFDDDDGATDEHVHNAVAAAGLFSGFDNGGARRAFKGSDDATRSTLAILAVRADAQGLVPVWRIPGGCLDGSFGGAYCDDDGSASEANHDALVGAGIVLRCRDLAGSPAFCGAKEATRAQTIYVLGGFAGIPLDGHPDAFPDDNGSAYEGYLDAAKAYGIYTGFSDGTVRPSTIATRDTLAIVLSRMYALPDPGVDYFTDDDGDSNEIWHNKVAAVGLFGGYDDGHGGHAFKGTRNATRDMLATLAMRARNAALTPVW